MKRFIRCTSLILAAVLLLSIPAFAAEAAEPRASYYFGSSSTFLCNVSGASFEAWFDVTGTGVMDEIGVNFIKIQRSPDGENWTTMRTFSKENYPHLLDYNSVNHSAGISYTGTRGFYYRAWIQLYAKNSRGWGEMDRYTSYIYIPVN